MTVPIQTLSLGNIRRSEENLRLLYIEKHIRELEEEVRLLEKALDENQLIMRFGEN